MNLHEYQAKNLLRGFGVPTPDGEVVHNKEEAVAIYDKMGSDRIVVKAQVHAGGRGKAGGVKLVSGRDEMLDAVTGMLGTNLVTFQTDKHGQPVNSVLLEMPSNIANELYISMLVDRADRRVTVMASTEGGMDIEAVAEETPEKILSVTVDPVVGLEPYQCREIFFKLELDNALLRSFTAMLTNLYKAFVSSDMAMLEINPLVVTAENKLICLDAKIGLDENAMYRHPALRELRDTTQEDPRETEAKKWDLNYIALEGDIACMVNGAGLAMATMDLIKLHGGEPANFLDVGGGATKERVTEAFKLITADSNVKAIFVNIFGGIVRCDLIAEGIIAAVEEVGISIPVVVRLQGNRAEEGAKLLSESGLKVIAENDLTEAAKKAIAAASE
jgi:succinyl-CoA synthetase beta subunit